MAKVDRNCFVCNQVSTTTDPNLSSDSGQRRRGKNLFILLQRALGLSDSDLAANQPEIVDQISFCKSCLDELEVVKNVLDAFDKMKKIAERHKKGIQSKFLESKLKNTDLEEALEGTTELRSQLSQLVEGLRSRSAAMADLSNTHAVFKGVTMARANPNNFSGKEKDTPPASRRIPRLPNLQISSSPSTTVPARVWNNDLSEMEINSEDGSLNMSSESDTSDEDEFRSEQGLRGPPINLSGTKTKYSTEFVSVNHQTTSSKNKPQPKSPSIPKNKSSPLTKPSQNTERKYKCQLCPARFKQKGNLQTHSRTHSGEKPFSCKFCPKTFSHIGNLKTHQVVHCPEQQVFCKFCSMAFATQTHLKVHERVHTGEKPYSCKICSKPFSQKGNLVTHVRSHSGEKPYKCTTCSKKFTQQSALIQHNKTHRNLTE